MTNKITNRDRLNCIVFVYVWKASILAILVDKLSLYHDTSKVDHKIVKKYSDYIAVWPTLVGYILEDRLEVSIDLN